MNNEEQIISLLTEQNHYLKSLYEFELKKQRSEHIKTFITVFMNLLPFIVILILGYIAYSIIMEYINALNNNINALKVGYESMIQTIQKMVPDFSGISNSIQSTWQSIKPF